MSDLTPTVSAAEAERPIFAGIDVGGTNIKFGIVDNRGNTVIRHKIPTESERGPDDGVQRMSQTVTELMVATGINADDVPLVGLATPGTMDLRAGMLLEPPNLPAWRQFPIRDRLSDACGKPVAFSNDATAAGFGEFWVGCGRDYPSIVLITLGTGIGAGIILGDMSIDGEHGHGSECGHTIIDYRDDARMCPCGQRGHLEAYTSAKALTKRATDLLASGRKSTITARVTAGEAISPLMLAEAAEGGDELSTEIILEAAALLGVGIVSIVHTIDPAAVVLGGAMTFGGAASGLGQRFLHTVRDEFRRRTFAVLAEKTVIDFAQLGGDAGYIGAAGIARTLHVKGHVSR